MEGRSRFAASEGPTSPKHLSIPFFASTEHPFNFVLTNGTHVVGRSRQQWCDFLPPHYRRFFFVSNNSKFCKLQAIAKTPKIQKDRNATFPDQPESPNNSVFQTIHYQKPPSISLNISFLMLKNQRKCLLLIFPCRSSKTLFLLRKFIVYHIIY